MRYFLDTEFNAFQGDLISLALVSAQGKELYFEIPCRDPLNEWVKEHVAPKLTGPVVGWETAQTLLTKFIGDDLNPIIICDWPADISHLCSLLDLNHGNRLGPKRWEFILQGGVDTFPDNPHYALSDARALRAAWMNGNVR